MAQSKETVIHTSTKEHTKFDLELPTFSGKPTDWRAFFDLFSSFLETRGKHLNDKEKRCINNYGSAMIVYPHYVRNLTTRETYTYDRESLRRMRQQFLLNYEALKALKADTLSQFLAALAFYDFGARLRDEWTKHIASKKTMATLEEMFQFFEPLEYSMAKIESNPASTFIKSSPSFSSNNVKKQNSSSRTPAPSSSTKGLCLICKEHNSLARCAVFMSHDIEWRNKIVRESRRCTNGLHNSHTQSKCPSSFSCRHCHGRHQSLLHVTDPAVALKPLP